MSGLEPIIYIISAIATETIKDVSKHFGKKAKETYDSLNGDIIELGINKDDSQDIIQQKLEANPEVKAEIERKIADNQESVSEIINFVKENASKNESKIEIKDITGSSINVNVDQNTIPQEKQKDSNHLPLIVISLFAVLGFFSLLAYFYAQSNQTTTPNSNTIVNSIVNSSINSASNSQTNVNISNTNNIIDNSKQTVEKERQKPTQKEKVPILTKPILPRQDKKLASSKTEVKPNPNATPSDCSSTTNGC